MKVNKSFLMATLVSGSLAMAPGVLHANDWGHDEWRYDQRRAQGPETARDAEGGFPFFEGSPDPGYYHRKQVLTRSEALELERTLAENGYDPGRVDGIVDSDTREALRQFQNDHQLAATGIIDPETGELLGIIIHEPS